MRIFSDLREIGTLAGGEYEEICRMNIDHVYVGDKTILCKILSRYKMYVDANDRGIAPHLIMDGYWESSLTQLLARIIQPGDVCIDVGANFGYYSVLMSGLTGDSGRVLSIEPNPRICDLLESTAFVNGGKFNVIRAAVSDQSGEATLTVHDRELGGGTIVPNKLEPGRSQVKVRTYSIDEIVRANNLEKADVIKIDVEGMEPVVLNGMKETIANNPGLRIVIEYSPSIYSDPTGFTSFLFDHFVVQDFADVNNIKRLDQSNIPALLAIPDHKDLYLLKK